MTRRFRSLLIVGAVVAVVALLAFARHLYVGGVVPAGQPALLSLRAENFDQLRMAFNAAAGDVRVVVLLSPT